MAGKSSIEWTGHTWNPVAGCTVLTPGCKRCYAMKMAARLEAMGQVLYAGLTKPSNAGPVWTGIVRRAPEHVLLAPLKRKKPTTYFVNSMSDLFHEDVPDEWIDKIFAVMALSPEHTFQVLTKRAERMWQYVDPAFDRIVLEMMRLVDTGQALCVRDSCEKYGIPWKQSRAADNWFPLRNVWLGVSTERQQEASDRIPLLLQTPAAVRFISAEPLLGPIDLANLGDATMSINAFTGKASHLLGMKAATAGVLDWVIVGGESGSGARPMQVEWVDQIIAQCRRARVACFVKQLGAAPLSAGYPLELTDRKGGDVSEWADRLQCREFPNRERPFA